VYDAAGRSVAAVNPLGQTRTTTYDVADRPVASIDPLGNTTTNVFDGADRPIASVDPLGQRNTTTYDAAGRAIASVNALGDATTFAYDAAGRRSETIDARGAVATTVYDAAGRTQATVDALGNRTTLAYDAAGRQVAVSNALGYVATTVHDAAGRAAAALDPLGFRTTFAYDAANRPVAQTDPLGHRTTSVYDAAGRLIATVNPLGDRATFSYDAAGLRVARTDANGHLSTTVYDAVGTAIAEVNALGHRTTAVFDAAGRRIGILDANGGRNTYTHDAAGRIAQHLDALGRATTFAYDAAGRQTSILDARAVQATFQYDAANRLTSRMSTNDPPVTFGYDAIVNRTVAVDGTGRSTFTYDLLGRRLTAVDPAGNAITYTYDALGQRATMTAPNGGVFSYAYGPRGQIAHLVNPQGDRTTFSYDAAGRRTLTELANGTRASYTYDGASRVAQLCNLKADDSVILGLTYEHDAMGTPVGMVESSGDSVTWTYDATDQLTREQRSGGSGYDTTYTYDPLGNRIVKEAPGALTTYAYDLANQLTTSQDASGVTTYTYDLAGNLQVVEQPTAQRTTNTWDDQNRQTRVLLPDGTVVTNTYRFDRLRLAKEDSQGVVRFIWDCQNYLAETDAENAIQAEYTNEPQSYGNLISQYRKDGGVVWTPSYYQYDALGSTRALTNGDGNSTDTYVYDAWGNEVSVSGSTVNPFQWVGRWGYYWDDVTGTFYIRARAYEPVTGRWTSQDPLFYPVANLLLTPLFLCSRDPIGYVDGQNLYANYLLFSSVDPSGNARMTIPPGGEATCATTSTESFVADCEFTRPGAGATWHETTNCPGLNAASCCQARANDWWPSYRGWSVVSSALKKKVVTTTKCWTSLGGVGLVKTSPCTGTAVTPAQGVVQTISIIVTIIPFPTTQTNVTIEETDDTEMCRNKFGPSVPVCPVGSFQSTKQACAVCNADPSCKPANTEYLDEDGFPIETEGLGGIVSHVACKRSKGQHCYSSIFCGKCCVNGPGGPQMVERCKCAR
jgi:RHS repeat-associated protein